MSLDTEQAEHQVAEHGQYPGVTVVPLRSSWLLEG